MDEPLKYPLGGRSIPPADVYVTAEEMTILVTLPGMTKEHLELKIKNGLVDLAGLAEEPRAGAKYLVSERLHGSFQRAFEVSSEFDINKARASYQNGTLKIIIPRTAEAESPVRTARNLVEFRIST